MIGLFAQREFFVWLGSRPRPEIDPRNAEDGEGSVQ
jgi:hypothetical protein